METKICNLCNIEKNLNDFPSKRKMCKPCFSEYKREKDSVYRAKNKEKIKKYKKDNRNKILIKEQEYRNKHKERIKTRDKIYNAVI